MTTIISPITSMLITIVPVTILVVVLFRIHRGRFSETSNLLRFMFLLLLATDIFLSTLLMTYYLVYMPYLFGLMFGILTSALFAAFCLGGIVPIDKKRAQDDVWTRWFKERNSWEEERKKRGLVDEK
jgi:hypothetical protein